MKKRRSVEARIEEYSRLVSVVAESSVGSLTEEWIGMTALAGMEAVGIGTGAGGGLGFGMA